MVKDEELDEAALDNLVKYFDVLMQIDQDEKLRRKRLEKEPNGYAMAGEGRNCSLCDRGVYDIKGWYDKWGFKCTNCQDAVNKGKIPGSLCGDWNNEKYVTDSTLSSKSGLHTQTIRKIIRRGDIKAIQIPKGPYLILRKDNPNLSSVIEAEQKK